MRMLISGASGFIGPQLVCELIGSGHELRATGRSRERVLDAVALQLHHLRAGEESLEATRQLQVVSANVITGEGLDRALADIDVAYYLIHSMESQTAGAFAPLELLGAQNFAKAARAAGVRRVIYLGGLTGQGSSSVHLQSREAVEQVLLDAIPDSVALRASIVIGARSRSFRFLVRLVERMPVLTLPAWRRYRTQPIDSRDVIEMLVRCAHDDAVAGRSLDIGGPDVLTYEQMIRTIAELMMVHRPAVGLRFTATPFTARVAAAIAGEDPELIVALMGGLHGDLLVSRQDAAELLDVGLHSFRSAVEHALWEWEMVEPVAAR